MTYVVIIAITDNLYVALEVQDRSDVRDAKQSRCKACLEINARYEIKSEDPHILTDV